LCARAECPLIESGFNGAFRSLFSVKKVFMGEISITKLLVVAALVVLLFGTKKLRTLGGDLGAAIKGFKKAMNDDDTSAKKSVDGDIPAEKLSHKE